MDGLSVLGQKVDKTYRLRQNYKLNLLSLSVRHDQTFSCNFSAYRFRALVKSVNNTTKLIHFMNPHFRTFMTV